MVFKWLVLKSYSLSAPGCFYFNDPHEPLNSFTSSMFQAFHAKTTGWHVALRERNSSAKSTREMFKCSKDSASLVVWNENISFLATLAHFSWPGP